MTAAQPFRGRREDARFLTGQGRYTADWTMPGQLYAAFRRSDVAHARLLAVNTAAAARSPGVTAVFTANDLGTTAFGTVEAAISYPGRGGSRVLTPRRPLLAPDRLRFVGEEIAVALAGSPKAALDAAERIEVTVEELPAAVGFDGALSPDAPCVHDEIPGNVCFEFDYGDEAAVGALLARATHRVSVRIESPRVAGAPMEPRSVLAWYDAERGTFEIRCSNQGAEAMIGQLAVLLGVPRERVRVHMVDVGGGFGPRAAPYPEYAILLDLARRLGRPIQWTSTRSEDFLCDAQGRGLRLAGELGLDADGRFLAMRTEWLCDQGAYLTSAGPLTNTNNGRLIAAGPYLVEAFYGCHRLVLTNAAPTNAYRGAARPDAALLIERLVDEAAGRLRADPLELRRRNAIGADRFPYRTPTGSVFDSGDYVRLLDGVRREVDWDDYPARRAEAAARGMIRGIGCGLFVEPCGGGFLREDQVALEFGAEGNVTAYIATTSGGQGHETVFPALVAARLGIDEALVTLRSSDPDGPPIRANGAIGSRSLLAQGSALVLAADDAAAKGKALAAALLEASVADIEFVDGRYRVRGTDLAVAFADLVRRFAVDGPHPLDTVHAHPSTQAFTSGAHVAEVEIDPETGETTLVAYVAVDDIGTVVNEVLAEGQVVGGVAQAAGQIFGERCIYDATSGQLLTGTFMDYTMPRADTLPPIRSAFFSTPSPTNTLGAKGVGETGTTGGLPTLMNAVIDALRSAGVDAFEMPATPARVWEALRQAR
jgi:carbon-monoxide dehydrogenase large subunit